MSRKYNTATVDVVKDNGGFYATPISRQVPCELAKLEQQSLSKIVQIKPGSCGSGTYKPGDRTPDVFPDSIQTMKMQGVDGDVWITLASYNSTFLTGCNGCCVS